MQRQKIRENAEMQRKNTVRRRIFLSNACVVLVTLLVLAVINIGIIKIYAESIEQEWKQSMTHMMNDAQVRTVIADWTIHRNLFLLLFLMDAVLCIAAFIVISHLFMRNLANHICEPLLILEEGINRMQENDFTRKMQYQGEVEFENVCRAFNDMQQHIMWEQEKNKKYEKARTDMIAGISHDLKTPLTAIKGTIKGMLDGIAKTPQQQRHFLQTAYRRSEDMDRLLNQFFYLSKLETGNMPCNCQKVDLIPFLKKYVMGKRQVLNREEERIEMKTELLQAIVLTDLEQMQRIFDNLVENSRKYAERKPLEMQIELLQKQQKLQIIFSDNGVGVPEEKCKALFTEFYRVDESRNKKEGNGLGLYIVKYLVDAMGGTVWAENQNGLGIYMELPFGK